MATINLGAIKFNWKGAYNSSTSYAVDDVVSSGGNSYICIQAHSNQAVGNATAYWNIMSSAGTNGTNGTDVGTTLTTQGDMLYRDGSGLQRLAKGTASQELRMNSGATAPEWHTPAVASSDFVKVASGTFSGSASVDFASSLFDGSTYHSFVNMIEVENNSGTQAGSGEFLPLINGSTSSAVSSNGIRMNSSSTNVNGLQRDNSNSCIFMTDGFRNMRALLKIESNGMNRAVNKNHIIHYNRPNQDATHRAIFEFHQVFHGNSASSNCGYRLTFPATCQGAYKLYGRKG
ncbi:hypothetical protein N9S53_00985 [Candidatus Pelagibacter sp.]|nr:hypothetical protein [Candidatus Pelagibacter sp.]